MAKQPKAPTNAPTVAAPVTGTGQATPPSSASFTPSPKLAPKPKDNGATLLADPSQRHPEPRGPATPGAA